MGWLSLFNLFRSASSCVRTCAFVPDAPDPPKRCEWWRVILSLHRLNMNWINYLSPLEDRESGHIFAFIIVCSWHRKTPEKEPPRVSLAAGSLMPLMVFHSIPFQPIPKPFLNEYSRKCLFPLHLTVSNKPPHHYAVVWFGDRVTDWWRRAF